MIIGRPFPKIPDEKIINKTFHNLKCLSFHHQNKKGRRYFNCICLLCGKTCIISISSLHGKTKSCGCLKGQNLKNMREKRFKLKRKMYINQKFNHLLILDIFKKDGCYIAKCKCDCGNIKNMRLDHVIKNDYKSCGCLRYKKQRKRLEFWDGAGYKKIYSPNHPRSRAGYVFEHILVVEKHLGRYLKSEEVIHHRDENRTNNQINNLRLFANQKEHMAWHFLKTKLQLKYLSLALKFSLKDKISLKEIRLIQKIYNKWKFIPIKNYSYKGLSQKRQKSCKT